MGLGFLIVLFLWFVGRWLLFLLLGLLVGFFGFWLVVFVFVCSGLGFFCCCFVVGMFVFKSHNKWNRFKTAF